MINGRLSFVYCPRKPLQAQHTNTLRKKNMERFIAYYRVSTDKQGRSGLGLEAQQERARTFTAGRGEIIAEFTEVESGKRNNRPQLAAAIEATKQHGARLLIAKVDRLARNAAFVLTLRDSGVKFTCADMPDANDFTINLFAIIAEHEAKTISDRTRAALAAKKARGAKLGSPQNLTDQARAKGRAAKREKARANDNTRRAAGFACLLRKDGYTFAEIAERLNADGHRAPKGGPFTSTQARRLVNQQTASL